MNLTCFSGMGQNVILKGLYDSFIAKTHKDLDNQENNMAIESNNK